MLLAFLVKATHTKLNEKLRDVIDRGLVLRRTEETFNAQTNMCMRISTGIPGKFLCKLFGMASFREGNPSGIPYGVRRLIKMAPKTTEKRGNVKMGQLR